MIKPTVGRMLWYWPTMAETIAGAQCSKPLAAVIANVWSDTCVNLGVFDANGNVQSRTSVLLVQEGGERPKGGGFAEWMPYQNGQAAKTEALEKQLVSAASGASDEAIEQEIQRKGLNAPRVTLEEVKANIVAETYTVLPNGRTTVCQLTLANGFSVEGMSACVSIENFNAEIGNKISRENAVDKVWELMGYALAERNYKTAAHPAA